MSRFSAIRPVIRAEAPWVLTYLPLTIALTWPLAARFSTALAGHQGDDAWQNLWNIAWLHRAVATGQNPFYTHDLWHPGGTSLVFQTFDLPDAAAGALLLGPLGPLRTYNLIALWTFFSSAAAMYALGRGTGASRPAAFLSGCAYSFSTYHFVHALGHLQLMAMQWVPLYVLAFWRTLETRSLRWAAAGGVFLTLASLASWYYLIDAFFISAGVVIAWMIKERARGLIALIPRALLLCVVFLTLIGPLGIAMVRERAREPYEGAHNAAYYSADAESFVFPNAVQELSGLSHRHDHWTGNDGENGSYLGALLILLALVGILLQAPRARVYVVLAVVGVAFSLGPALHVHGKTVTGDVLPYVWLTRAVPLLDFMGMPVRFAFVATFALAAALAPSLDALRRWFRWRWLAPLGALAVLEHLPQTFAMGTYPTPAPLAKWASDPRPFAVLDACRDNRHLWHQMLHTHPIFDGYISRQPVRFQREIDADPVAGPLRTGLPPKHAAPFRAAALDFPFNERVVDGAERTYFSFDLRGTLVVNTGGPAEFRVLADDGAVLKVDGHLVVDNGGAHEPIARTGTVDLIPGEHEIAVHYEQQEGGAVLRVTWTPPGEDERVLGQQDVPAGFSGRVHFTRKDTALSQQQALQYLWDLHVKYILQPSQDSHYLAERQLGLSPQYEGEGVTIYEIPDPP
jgi:PA14 domain